MEFIRYSTQVTYLCLLFDKGNLVNDEESHLLWVELLHPLEPHTSNQGLAGTRRQDGYQILLKSLNKALHLFNGVTS